MNVKLSGLQSIAMITLTFVCQLSFASPAGCDLEQLNASGASKEIEPVPIEEAKANLIRCAETGNEMAVAWLMLSYLEGNPAANIDKDHNALLKFLETGASTGNTYFQDMLVKLYTDNDFLKLTDETEASARFKAYKWYYASLASKYESVRKFKKIKSLESKMNSQEISQAMAEGEAIYPQNFKKNGDSVYNKLGHKYFEGKVVEKDLKKAHEYNLKAAHYGNEYAQYRLGKHYTQGIGYVDVDGSEGIRWYEKSAEQGNAYALFALGEVYLNGSHVAQDIPKAIGYIEAAAEKGNSEAKVKLGEFYVNGTHVDKDAKRAFELFLSASNTHNSQAQYYLGHCYNYGIGVAKDSTTAYRWYMKSAKAGNPDAQYSMAVAKQNGVAEANIPQSLSEAASWYSKASAQGHAKAQFNLGILYAQGGDGVEKNLYQAYKEILLSRVKHEYKEKTLASITQQMSQSELAKVGELLDSLK